MELMPFREDGIACGLPHRGRRLPEEKPLIGKKGQLLGIEKGRKGGFVGINGNSPGFLQDRVCPDVVFMRMGVDDRCNGESRQGLNEVLLPMGNPRIDEKIVCQVTGGTVEILPEKPPRHDETENAVFDNIDLEHLQAIDFTVRIGMTCPVTARSASRKIASAFLANARYRSSSSVKAYSAFSSTMYPDPDRL